MPRLTRAASLCCLPLIGGCAAFLDAVSAPVEGGDTGAPVEAPVVDSGGLAVDPADHCGPVRADQTWGPAGSLHTLSCDVDVQQGTLTLMEGVELRVAPGAALTVGIDGPARLRVDGAAGAPVRIGAAEGGGRGAWEGLQLGPGAAGSALRHLRLSGGGRARGGLRLDEVEVELLDVEVSGAEGCALVLDGAAGLAPGSGGLRLRGSGAPACAPVRAAGTFPGGDSDYSGNDVDQVVLEGEVVSASASWAALNVPYAPTDDLRVEGAEAPTLTLKAGVQLWLGSGAALHVGRSAPGALRAEGEAGAPVLITGADGWGGLRLHPSAAESSLQHVIVEGAAEAGLEVEGALVEGARVDGAVVELQQVELRDNGGPGLLLHPGAALHPHSLGLRLVGNALPLRVAPAQVEGLLGLGLVAVDNDAQVIEVAGSERLDRAARWLDLGLPYQLPGDLRVDGADGAPAVLTLGPGARLHFGARAALLVGDEGPAGLIAEGAAGQRVELGPAGEATPGAWGGVRIGEHATEGVSLRSFSLRWAGGGGPRGALELRGPGPLVVANGEVSGTAPGACAVAIYAAEATLGDLDLRDNPGGDLCWR
ncbi:MAG: hypothetical protein JNM72_05215 [Deltaproteobacteria bacterium]|nr:hypothetical protein [Deltaproteobacteria bacterium]